MIMILYILFECEIYTQNNKMLRDSNVLVQDFVEFRFFFEKVEIRKIPQKAVKKKAIIL